MAQNKLPGKSSNAVRQEGGGDSTVFTIPSVLVDELEIEDGEEPEVTWDDDSREVSLRFE